MPLGLRTLMVAQVEDQVLWLFTPRASLLAVGTTEGDRSLGRDLRYFIHPGIKETRAQLAGMWKRCTPAKSFSPYSDLCGVAHLCYN
jgi:hypothetical protein